jgi:hypothetical protein
MDYSLGRHRKPKNIVQRQQVQLDEAQELAAVSSFLASLPQNVIPSHVDPKVSIDPQLVLDFDSRSARAADEVQSMTEDVWARFPVFLYSKVGFVFPDFRCSRNFSLGCRNSWPENLSDA